MSAVIPSRFVLDGRAEPGPAPRPLRAGPLGLLLDGGDLRYLTCDGAEVLRRVYAAVRDRNWGTVVGRISQLSVDAGPDGFRARFDMEHREADIDFVWRGEITGRADGTITFAFDGRARSRFLRNRIGFCVLHPAACAGQPAEVEHTDGRRARAPFPTLVDGAQPLQPFADLRAVSHQVRPGLWAEVRFEGDVFEMEDQRNWTDGSFKTFCTPLALPFPVEVPAGTRIRQSVTVRLRAEAPIPVRAPSGPDADMPVVQIDARSARPLPALGLGAASHDRPLDRTALERLRALGPAHLRVDFRADRPDAEAVLARGVEEARAIGAPVELAVVAAPADSAALGRLRGALERLRPALARVLVYVPREAYGGGSPTREAVLAARAALGPLIAGTPVAAGTNTDLIFLNRNPPPPDVIDAVTFAVNPQVHAFDEASLVETLEAQEAAVRTAAHLGAGKPVLVSPVTLKPRFNPYATAEPAPVPPDELPPEVDVRQLSLFGAAWTVGSLRALATAGAHGLTFYETTGWRGVVETEAGSALPARFPSAPGAVFPLYHVLAEVAGLRDAEVLATRSSRRLAAEALALRAGGRLRALVANHTAGPLTVRVEGLPAEVRVAMLDQHHAAAAAADPASFRAGGAARPTRDGALTLTLEPYAVARLA